MPPAFPNLFVIGAMKAGTTALHECLARHPELFMTRFKEPQYFAPHPVRFGVWGQGGTLPEPGIAWYLRLFEKARDVRYAGESSTSYTKAPWVTGCAERIRAFNQDARLIYLMRDPAERTLSQYWYEVAGLRESRPLMDAVLEDERFIAFSDYARQLRPYLDAFGRDAVHVLTLEELAARPAETLDEIFRWLDVERLGARLSFEGRNVGAPALLQVRPALGRFREALRHWRWRRFARDFPAAAGLAQRLLMRPVKRGGAEEHEAREYLRPIQGEQVRRLSALVGREFPEWPSASHRTAPARARP
jgi:hypothetical protein